MGKRDAFAGGGEQADVFDGFAGGTELLLIAEGDVVAGFAVEDLGLWSPTPGIPSEVFPGEEIRSDWWR